MSKTIFSIAKDERELLKIIPIGNADGREFKLSIRADIELWLFPSSYNNEGFNIYDGLDKGYIADHPLEFTYHRKKDDAPTKIHFKNLKPGSKSVSLPFKSMIEPNNEEILPVPFCKIACADSTLFPELHHRDKKKVLDLNETIKTVHNDVVHNVAEIFLVGPSFEKNADNFQGKWGLFYLMTTQASIENNARPDPEFSIYKSKCMGEGQLLRYRYSQLTDDIAICVCTYHDANVDGVRQKSHLTFVENGNYLKFLACTPVQFKLKSKLTEIKYAYEWQLEFNRHMLSDSEYEKWMAEFEAYKTEIENAGIRFPGLIIPQF